MSESVALFQEKANSIRKNIIKMITEAKAGHPGGSLSITDILTVLYFDEMRVDPENPGDEDRDRFVLSKGHGAPALYATLAERGFFDPAELMTLRKINSRMQGHPNMKLVPGVDASTGSLGQGISMAVGMAMSGKISKKDFRVHAILGDGELEEGQVWEAAMSASQYDLDNLVAFVDYNGLQIDGELKNVVSPEPITDKFAAFNWNVLEINGHDYIAIQDALAKAKAFQGKPTCIVAHTIKGKGVSFMENKAGWHGVAPSAQQADEALKELEECK